MIEVSRVAIQACRDVNSQLQEEDLHKRDNNRKAFNNLKKQQLNESEPKLKSDTKQENIQNIDIFSTQSSVQEEILFEYSEIGWTGTADEMVLMMIVAGFQCIGEKEQLPMLDSRITKMGLSFRNHRKYKSVLQVLYIQTH